ncbi:ArsI/CadI family heavy metal resistance metalloenzyme [Granulosicoccaceae sp. 1_MG-2023]|nr:ArsI/CadI family heavy metal resistance metalloenzyme [Granulosicoccaceae sp. 1_MG-2023]
MARMHLHISVESLAENIRFYSALFGCGPSVEKADYAKWELTDPAVNFAISARGNKPGLDHVGIQAADDAQLGDIETRLKAADISGLVQEGTTCCYARSDKTWVTDPQGIAWEAFHTLGDAPTFNDSTGSCGVPAQENSCCAPTPAGNCCAPSPAGKSCC